MQTGFYFQMVTGFQRWNATYTVGKERWRLQGIHRKKRFGETLAQHGETGETLAQSEEQHQRLVVKLCGGHKINDVWTFSLQELSTDREKQVKFFFPHSHCKAFDHDIHDCCTFQSSFKKSCLWLPRQNDVKISSVWRRILVHIMSIWSF